MTSSASPVAVSAATSTTSTFPIAVLLVLLIVAVVVFAVLLVVFGRFSWRPRGRMAGRRLTRIQRAAAADVAELRQDDLYAPDGPGLKEEDDL
jgi:amino acid transporter